MSQSYTVHLEQVNSVFGISADTAQALAASRGITVEQLIAWALVALARQEIPDLDLDEPALNDAQLQQLEGRRRVFEVQRHPGPRVPLAEQFNRLVDGSDTP